MELISEALAALRAMRFGRAGYVVVIDPGKHAGMNPLKPETEVYRRERARNDKRRPGAADRGIDKPEDLKGKRIACLNAGRIVPPG
ncbi:hypothetical protein [Paraburkholderia sp. MM5477-R1]|uniref:hypothetical protein n=1 Tax=Paraburkholderia sp. MM5477-R1 TaxID=2991062 RepID=UPI003D25AC95